MASMIPRDPAPLAQRAITDREFEIFRALVASHTGIALGPHKRALLEARLGKRVRALGLDTFMDYHRVLMEGGPDGEEMGRFVNAVTTNKTSFFREPHHFAHLAERWAPAVQAPSGPGADRRLRVWSAGCSSGEEPYSIAMTLLDALGAEAGWDVRILASDIDTDMLKRAEAGVYTLDELGDVPRAMLRRHFLRGTGASTGLVRVRPAVRDMVRFRRINLLDHEWPVRVRFDIVFCRNVLIYFDQPTQESVIERLSMFVKDDGLLILGHSEGVHGKCGGLRHAGNTIFHKETGHVSHHSDR